jgi:hypothetical protein
VSTQVSALTARFGAVASVGGGRGEVGDLEGSRSTSWRLYLVLALVSLVLGSLSLLYPSTPSYDPWGWLLWGREILHLKLNTVGSNSFKPLPVLFTLPFALFGRAQPDLWLAVGRSGAIFAVLMAFKLAARLTMWFGAGPGERRGAARVIAYGPAVLAGGIAALSVVIAPEYIRDAAIGYSECLGAGMVLLAFDRHLDDKPRQAFVCGFIPGLDRPEIWAFWGLYGLYLLRRDPGAWKLVAALFGLMPCLWFLPELWGSGHLFRGVTRALHPHAGAATFTKCPFCTEMKAASQTVLSRVKVTAGLMAVGAAAVIWRALRRRPSGRRQALREQAHRPVAIVLVMAVVGVLWFLEISGMTQYGFSGNDRYLIIGGALLIVVGAVGWGLVAWQLGALLARWAGRASGVAAVVATAVVTVAFLFGPNWVGTHFQVHKIDRALRYQGALRKDLSTLVARAGGGKKIVACGVVETENYEVPMVAWYLGVESIDVSDELPRAPDGAPADPNVILQARDTGTARLLPLVPKAEHYTELKQGTFNLYEHCK